MITILTDSTCDIPADLIERHRLATIPFLVVWDGETYRDRIDMTPDEFYRRLADGPSLPTTAFPGPNAFADVYREVANQGADSVVLYTIPAKLSGENAAAKQAAIGSPVPVHVVDSCSTSLGMGFQVLAAVRAAEAGASMEQVIAAGEYVRSRMQMLVYLDTLDYVFRGGRLNRVSWAIGSALNIKGLVSMEHTDGSIIIFGRAHGKRRAIDQLYAEFFKRVGPPERSHVAVLHSGNEEDALALHERVRAEQNPAELLFNSTGPILGTHAGPGALALIGYADD